MPMTCVTRSEPSLAQAIQCMQPLCDVNVLNSRCAPLQFDWEAGIAEDVAEADFGGDEAMEGDEQAIEEEEEVDVGEDTASAAVQQDDFARRMAAFADAFD